MSGKLCKFPYITLHRINQESIKLVCFLVIVNLFFNLTAWAHNGVDEAVSEQRLSAVGEQATSSDSEALTCIPAQRCLGSGLSAPAPMAMLALEKDGGDPTDPPPPDPPDPDPPPQPF